MSTPDLPGSSPQPSQPPVPPTEQVYTPQQPTTGFPPPAPNGDGTGEPKKPWFKRKRIIIPVAVVALFIAIGAAGAAGGAGKDSDEPKQIVAAEPAAAAAEVTVPETTGLTAKEAQALLENAGLEISFSADSGVVLDRDNWTVLSTTPAAGATAKEGDTVVVNVEKTAKPEAAVPAAEEPAAPAAPEAPSLEHANALRAAQDYLNVMAFSRLGLIDQLSSQYGASYPVDVATWAADNAGADWNAQAAKAAQQYLDTMSFSRQGLYDQLTSEYGGKFTPDEANAGLAAVGY